ncbi:SLC13 family permease [Candidatus Vondammii sp. HM_W22]|uniref:SLC13 family permease n=1 Tax=Candidatus Vondammii sp. HM_W22 TaxID=2687299 RepID=UPI001F13B3F0|nr:SLC13 family permease [Candidatus Vondammii sp. HM_W22]
MTTDQIVLYTLLIFIFVFLIWGRWRYDLVAFVALIAALVIGVVPKGQAFSGFGHPATIITALVLIISRGLSNSGAIELLARQVGKLSHSMKAHIAAMSGISALLSAVMNNVAALALLMPVDLQAARKAKRSPAFTLMPLSFASILGGMITLIGTPPNIIIAEFREKNLGRGFSMFDFTPVGLACAVAGVIYVASIGWRLISVDRQKQDISKELMDISGYLTELHVPEGSKAIGQRVRQLDSTAEENDVLIAGVVRKGVRLSGRARWAEIQEGDILVIESGPEALDGFVGVMGLDFRQKGTETEVLTDDNVSLLEVVVPREARIEGRSALSLRLQYRHDITLLGVSRQGHQFRDRVRKLKIQAGDVLLLFGPNKRLSEISGWLGTLPLAQRGLELIQRDKALLAAGIFAAAILLSSLDILYLPVALSGVVALYAMLKIVHSRQIYNSVEWPVIVLVGSMIPIGTALESSGGTAQIADLIVGLSAGYSLVVVLVLLMTITMTLSDVMNNTATAVIVAPIAVRLQVNPDPFLMTVAVAASCAFLTPIGHKNNTLIMGPGGYRFGDYWRMGLPLEILVVLVSIPMILWVWPL